MKRAILRAIGFSVVWLAFWIGSTLVVTFIDDIGSGYWALGGYAFPVFLLAFLFVDWRLKDDSWVVARPFLSFVIMSIVGMLLYYPGVIGVLLAHKFFGVF